MILSWFSFVAAMNVEDYFTSMTETCVDQRIDLKVDMLSWIRLSGALLGNYYVGNRK